MHNEIFPIEETNGEATMNNISPSSLLHLHFLTSEDTDTLMFEFIFVCRTYDYASDEKNSKLFPSTFKDATLHWFMSLPRGNITTWVQIQQ